MTAPFAMRGRAWNDRFIFGQGAAHVDGHDFTVVRIRLRKISCAPTGSVGSSAVVCAAPLKAPTVVLRLAMRRSLLHLRLMTLAFAVAVQVSKVVVTLTTRVLLTLVLLVVSAKSSRSDRESALVIKRSYICDFDWLGLVPRLSYQLD